MEKDDKEILYFKTERERMAYLRNRVTIEPIEYVPPREEEEKATVKKGKKKKKADDREEV